MNICCSVAGHIILLNEAAVIRESHYHEGMCLVCNNVFVGAHVKVTFRRMPGPSVNLA